MKLFSVGATTACLMALILLPRAAADAFSDRIDIAIERGVSALRRTHSGAAGGDGTNATGRSALVGLALLECGVPRTDPLVRIIVDAVRQRCVDANRVYDLALAILLFDRHGDDRDVPLIQALAVRLLEGQFKEGGWSYTTPIPDETEVRRLRGLHPQRAELRAGGPSSEKTNGRMPLDPDLERRLKRIGERGPGGHQAQLQSNPAASPPGVIDNSNTQFAIMGLWAARRHGIPVDFALRLCEAYFRATHQRGTWTYSAASEPWGRGGMTCAGLMSLAIGSAVVREHQLKTAPDAKTNKPPALRDPLKDPLVQVALNYVSEQLAKEAIEAEQGVVPNYYFLWSLERVGVTYSLTLMGGRNWHQIGARALMLHQRVDGSWQNHHGADADTCFALMFLKKANLALDLTAALQRKSTAQSALRADDTERSSDSEGDPKKLSRELMSATPERQEKVLEQLRDGNGTDFTEALIQSITMLRGEQLTKARDCLAERLARMTAATIRDKLKDARPEMRRAAALACAMKEDKELLQDLIGVLDDADSVVIRAAGVALRSLTGQNFGPSATATVEDRARAVAAWKAWWRQQKGR